MIRVDRAEPRLPVTACHLGPDRSRRQGFAGPGSSGLMECLAQFLRHHFCGVSCNVVRSRAGHAGRFSPAENGYDTMKLNMKSLSRLRMWNFGSTLSVALVVVAGCNAEQSPSKTETGVPRGSADQIKGLANDLKPPVIVKPDSPPPAPGEPSETKPKPPVE
jgi:hypothetical protein